MNWVYTVTGIFQTMPSQDLATLLTYRKQKPGRQISSPNFHSDNKFQMNIVK